MTSIFNTFYASNETRLNSSMERAQPEKHEANPRGEHFAQILADVEKKGAKGPDAAKLPAEHVAPKPPPVPALSNLDKDELKNGSTPASSVPRHEPVVEQNLVLRNPTAYQGVKLSPDTVKDAAPQIVSALETVQKPQKPSAPTIIAVNRLAADNTEQSVKTSGHGVIPRLTADELSPDEILSPPSAPKIARAQRLGLERIAKTTVNPAAGEDGEDQDIRDIITTAGRFYGIDPNLSMAVAKVESAFDPDAVSRDGHHSKGIFQLLDATGKHMLHHSGVDEAYNPFDPAQNTYLGVGYLRKLHDIFSVETNLGGAVRTVPASSADHLEKLAVAAFNTGEGNVARAQARARADGQDPSDFRAVEPYLPASTRRYVRKVSELRQAFAALDSDKETI